MRKPLLHHMQWADANMWRALLGAPGAEDNEMLHDLVHHIHLVQHAYLRVWTNQPLDLPEATTFESLSALLSWAKGYYREVSRTYLDKVSEADLEEIIELPWKEDIEKMIGKSPESASLGDTMVQVAMHTGHHRGQVMTLLREAGVEPPLIDFAVWIWRGKPAPEWPEPSS